MTPEKLDAFPSRLNVGRPKGSKYDKLLDGNIWSLQPGVDFQQPAVNFIRAIRQHANSRRGMGLSAVIMHDGSVVVQAKEKKSAS
jgi:hypothetical protein